MKQLPISFGQQLSLEAQLNPNYYKGQELGKSGKEPPLSLNQVTQIKAKKRQDQFDFLKGKDEFYKKDFDNFRILDVFGDKNHREPAVETELNPDAFSFRLGYISGLEQFMTSKGIDFLTTGLFGGVDVISSDDGLVGFVRGAKLESPSIPRNYSARTKSDKFEYILNKFDDKPSIVDEMNFKSMVTQTGYRLGFTVAIARDYGVVLKSEQIPMDNASYQAFQQGLRGESRPLPMDEVRTSRKEEKFLNDTPYVAEMKAFEWMDNGAYHTGLKLWLKSQGIQGVDTWMIRHPASLRAFKSALAGEVISEYEPPKPRFSGKDLTENNIISLLEREYKYPEKQKYFDKFNLEPTPMEVARQHGQIGYDLGKSLRLFKR